MWGFSAGFGVILHQKWCSKSEHMANKWAVLHYILCRREKTQLIIWGFSGLWTGFDFGVRERGRGDSGGSDEAAGFFWMEGREEDAVGDGGA